MADEFKNIAHTDDISDALPTDEAAERAQEELDALTPAESEPFHIGQEGVVTQTDEDPIRDFVGRSDGP